MICILLGVRPPEEEIGCSIVEGVTRGISNNTENYVVQWASSYTSAPLIVPDPETGAPTLLLQAHTNAPVDCVMDLVQRTRTTCELWATSPAPLPMISGGSVRPPWVGMNEDTPTITNHVTVMREWGLYFQKSLIKDTSDLRRAIEQEIANVELHIARNRPDLKLGEDEFRFQEIASRNTQRFDLLVTKVEAVHSFVEMQVLNQGHVIAFLEYIIGNDWEFDVSVVYSKPGASFQGWHADGNHENGANDAGWVLDGWQHRLADPYAICLFLPLIDLNDDVGFTQFWPGSHRHRDLLGFGKLAELMGSWDGKCRCGDGIWYDYRLFHRGMPNKSTLTRPVVQILFRQSWYVERANYGTEPIISRRMGE